jgi:hypothetical protein
MKTILSLALAVVLSPIALTLFTQGAQASDTVEERHVKLIVNADDGEAVKLDLSDLALGETTQHTTDSGKLVTITRDDEGYLIDIEGKEIRVAALEHFDHEGDHDGEGPHKIMVKVHADGDGDEGEREIRIEKHVMVTADGETIVSHGGEGDEGHEVRVIRLGDGDGHGVKVLADLDCEDGEEACIERLLSEHGIHVEIDQEGDGDGENIKVIVIEKKETTDDE